MLRNYIYICYYPYWLYSQFIAFFYIITWVTLLKLKLLTNTL
jgi:hypothetical protein